MFVEEEVCAYAKRLGRLNFLRLKAHTSLSGDLIVPTPQALVLQLQPYVYQSLQHSATPAKHHIMAETTPISDDTEIFKQLESYPWEKDKEFQVSFLKYSLYHYQPRHVCV